MLQAPDGVKTRIRQAERLRLFLDYDGTLADFAPTPEHVEPDPEVIALLAKLAHHPSIRPMVISGRRLAHVKRLLPVPEILLAGTYGVELRLPTGEDVDRIDYAEIRPMLDVIKPRWEAIIAEGSGFFLEDKDWALAVHGRYAPDAEAEKILEEAKAEAKALLAGAPPELFRILGGHKFLEVGPTLAHKGRTVEYLLERYPWPGALPLYVGDDDKDEEAFSVIHAHGGLAVRVCKSSCDTAADGRLESPRETRQWLRRLTVRGANDDSQQ
jgi:trehalose 6-phosphate phosphatase